jgi:glutathione S-transferase
MSKIIVHHLEKSRSQRILWLLEEIGLDYEIKEYKRDPKTIRAPKELRDIHPLGRSPVVTVDELVLVESGAILESLVERFAPDSLRPQPGSSEYLDFRYWMHYAEGSFMPPLLVSLIFGQLRDVKLPFFLKPVVKGIAGKVDAAYTHPEMLNHMSFVENALGQHSHFVGDSFSAADIQMGYPVEAALKRGAKLGDFPNMQRWLDTMKARPAYKRAEEKGGPAMP